MTLVNPPKHPNAFEHFQSFPRFVVLFALCGTAGGVLGRLTDKTISLLEPETRTAKASAFFLQLLVNAAMFFVAFRLLTIQKLTVDDWASGTFQGIIFVTTFYTVQEEFLINLKGALL